MPGSIRELRTAYLRRPNSSGRSNGGRGPRSRVRRKSPSEWDSLIKRKWSAKPKNSGNPTTPAISGGCWKRRVEAKSPRAGEEEGSDERRQDQAPRTDRSDVGCRNQRRCARNDRSLARVDATGAVC